MLSHNKPMKIYTRTGDDGRSGLYSGERLPKSDDRFEIIGTLDELNAAIGFSRASAPHADVDAPLRRVQELLFELGADVANLRESPPRVGHAEVEWLERRIDEMTAVLPPLRTFILPGGHPAAAALHVARAVCRRAERLVVRTSSSGNRIPPAAAVFLNRLSDFLFTAARFQNHLAKVTEDAWIPNQRSTE